MELNQFVDMSNYAGERFDLVQAGGGNTSVKFDNNKMYIKASGYLLSEVDDQNGFSIVDFKHIGNILDNPKVITISDKRYRDEKAFEAVKKSVFKNGPRPSIETYLHALLEKYTLHVHSIAINVLTCHKDWKSKLNLLNENILAVPYQTPGIDLAIEMKDQLRSFIKEHGFTPKIICLQNHGLIVTSNIFSEIQTITEQVVLKAEKLSKINLERFKHTTKISSIINKISETPSMCYLSTDKYISQQLNENEHLFYEKPFSPDGFIFCGYSALKLSSLSQKAIIEFVNKYQTAPKVIVYDGNVYYLASSLKKAKMIEDVHRSNLMIQASLNSDIVNLDEQEIAYLGNWEAEKFRQNI